jgi:hypothetical protein
VFGRQAWLYGRPAPRLYQGLEITARVWSDRGQPCERPRHTKRLERPVSGRRASPLMAAGGREKWVTKQQLAVHLQVTPRWIESQQRLGLPHIHMVGVNRYVLSEVEVWLRERYGEPRAEVA